MNGCIAPPMTRVSPIDRRARLLAWYDQNRRDLPWRGPPGVRVDPYRVWLSEIMLQQTTVPHATPYFLTFVARWPAVGDLAAADDADVMAAWAGLGYYARARNLLACARVVARDLGGAFPANEAALRALPGIGDYTAAAIGAIAFDLPTNVVDGNVERVMARLLAVEAPLPAAKPALRRLAAEFVTTHRPGDWAQALMDLGSGVCRPKSPVCPLCPLNSDCAARRLDATHVYPRRTPKAASPHRHGVVYRMIRHGQVALVRRPPRGLLGGMLAMPTTAWRAEPFSTTEALAAAPTVADWIETGTVDHVFTHFSLTLRVFAADVVAGDGAPWVWAPLSEALVSIPSLFAKALK